MNDAVIRAEGLGKKYLLRHERQGNYTALRDVISEKASSLLKPRTRTKETFWALKDVSFELRRGEALGIIGRNGSGKSTLLKLLSRITEPTAGRAEISGKVSSLLEIGTGFHPELTGRENIFLNGAILGMRREEVKRKFDEIVAFAGVEKFLDTPVKHFSSGMYLRLAFAVAAHLEPEILIVDEVLAVGDAEFQKKCLGKMDEVSREKGRSILFVSHNMQFVASLCQKAIWLEEGKIKDQGPAPELIGRYLAGITQRSAEWTSEKDKEPGSTVVSLQSVAVVNSRLQAQAGFSSAEKIGLQMRYRVHQPGSVLWLGYNLSNQFGAAVFDTHSVRSKYYLAPHEAGDFTAVTWIPSHLLNTGTYFVGAAIFNHRDRVIHCHEKDLVSFHVYDDPSELSARGLSPEELPGAVRPLLDWSIEKQ